MGEIKRIKITDNFYLDEFKVSADYPELAEKIKFTDKEKKAITYLCKNFLQPIRDYFKVPVIILSAKRSTELNTEIKGESFSDHLTADAVDFYIPGVSMQSVFLWVIAQNMPFRQLIIYPDQNFLHISQNNEIKPHKHQALMKYQGKFVEYKL